MESPILTSPDSAVLRAYPYPYRAAFTLSNDADLLAPAVFERTWRFLCGRGATPYGEGLGLALSNSFYFLQPLGSERPRPALTLFGETPAIPHTDTDRVVEWIRAGVLDCVHGQGAYFAKQYPFTREMAERNLDWLVAKDLRIPVWSNHGGSERTNEACLSPEGKMPEAQGDLPGTLGYHADLTCSYFDFVWTWESSGMSSQLLPEPTRDERLGRRWSAHFKEGQKEYVLSPALNAPAQRESLLRRSHFRDGSSAISMTRFDAGCRKCVCNTLARQLNFGLLSEAVQQGACIILYQHLGALVDPSANILPATETLTPENIEIWRSIAQLRDSGILFVDTFSRVLNYLKMRDSLVFSHHLEPSAECFQLRRLQRNGWDLDQPTTAADLRGLTFYIRGDRPVHIEDETGRAIPTILNPPDFEGRPSVSVPWEGSDFSSFF